MYSVNIIEGENRVLLQCNFVENRFIKFSAVYDTGAEYTCVTAVSLNSKLTENDFKDSETMVVGGLIDSNNVSVKYYKLHVMDFYLGNIHITGVDIWVTFDDRITDSVVGYDILRRVTRLGIENSNIELFFKDTAELLSYVKKNEQTIKQMDFGIIQKKSSSSEETLRKTKFTKEDLNANYIQKLIEKDEINTSRTS